MKKIINIINRKSEITQYTNCYIIKHNNSLIKMGLENSKFLEDSKFKISKISQSFDQTLTGKCVNVTTSDLLECYNYLIYDDVDLSYQIKYIHMNDNKLIATNGSILIEKALSGVKSDIACYIPYIPRILKQFKTVLIYSNGLKAENRNGYIEIYNENKYKYFDFNKLKPNETAYVELNIKAIDFSNNTNCILILKNNTYQYYNKITLQYTQPIEFDSQNIKLYVNCNLLNIVLNNESKMYIKPDCCGGITTPIIIKDNCNYKLLMPRISL